MHSKIDREKTRKTIAGALEHIKTEADPWLLAEYFSLFKKEVPLFHRSKVAAYLLMLCEQKGIRLDRPARRDIPAGADRNARRPGGERRPAPQARDEGKGDAQRYPLAEEESRRLFFSVGRSRRVFPREILGLINSKTAIPKEDIGAIRILDNYSFVQVRDTVAEQIIEALSGVSFRGRPLTVNYAKSRKDEENSAAENGNGNEVYADEDESSPGYAEADDDTPRDDYAPEDQEQGDSEQGHDHPEEKDI
ncbi:MAG: DbpA RNA binding domain-containing protein [Treponema sp.]|jgi:hypothetical protein|nr:DbpA RNA binding domain-containing protein [Treponema sp.]